MDLWIRSQDKTKIVKVNYVFIMESNNHFTIYGETIDSSPIIGVYNSKERALEVLDEIQEIINCLDTISMFNLSDNTTSKAILSILEERNIDELSTIYEMPKE